jgi:hypothetical protein
MAGVIMAQRMRRSLRQQRVFRDRMNPLETKTDMQLYKAYRFHRGELLAICDDIKDEIEYPASRLGALPPMLQVRMQLSTRYNLRQ